ncbi:hypothetical protein CYL31_03995 [Marinomonas sp. A3A]|nr:hypothetical protein CYL31_03995 [Marinomonas sp. A3A]
MKIFLPKFLIDYMFLLRNKSIYMKYRNLTGRNVQFKNKGSSKRVFILGSGNSLKEKDLIKMKHENIIVLNNGIAIDFYEEIMSGEGTKIHLIAPIHKPQEDEEWIAWFKKLEADIPKNVEVFIGLNSYKRNAYELIKENSLFLKNKINWYFVGKDMPELAPLSCRSGLDFSKIIYSGEAASIYGLILAEYFGFDEVYLLGMDHDYFLHDNEATMRVYDKSEHQKNEFERTFGDNFYINEFYRQYLIFKKYKKMQISFKSHIYSCSGPVLKIFERIDYDEVFDDI